MLLNVLLGLDLEKKQMNDLLDDTIEELEEVSEEVSEIKMPEEGNAVSEVKPELISEPEDKIQVIEDKEKYQIDAKKMIIYSEIMKPKFNE